MTKPAVKPVEGQVEEVKEVKEVPAAVQLRGRYADLIRSVVLAVIESCKGAVWTKSGSFRDNVLMEIARPQMTEIGYLQLWGSKERPGTLRSLLGEPRRRSAEQMAVDQWINSLVPVILARMANGTAIDIEKVVGFLAEQKVTTRTKATLQLLYANEVKKVENISNLPDYVDHRQSTPPTTPNEEAVF